MDVHFAGLPAALTVEKNAGRNAGKNAGTVADA
jgi:hypothetical protein